MAGFCLMPQAVDNFKKALVDGTIDPYKLNQLSSEDRRAIFAKVVGDGSAKDVNALFESKILLKNQKYAYTNWAKKVAGLAPDVKRDLLTRIGKMDKVLNPDEEKVFLQDLAEKKLGVGVDASEAKKIAILSQKAQTAQAAMEKGGDRMAYGHAQVKLANYVNELKVGAQKFSFKGHPLTVTKNAIGRIPGESKAINASMDNSAIFRQGWKTLWTNPRIWQKNAQASFVNLAKQFGGKEVMNEVHADIISRPTYDKMLKAKLAVSNLEEAFPTTAPEKIPILGRAYKASEAAYTAFVQKTRADVFDKYLQIAEKSGVNTNDRTELEAIGSLVNSLTGRGGLGSLERVGDKVNNVFFSPRFLKSNLDLVLQPVGRGGATTGFARKQAAINLLKIVSGTAAILTTANAVKPGSVEFDPRSADFGKIKVGDTRFDVTGGAGSIVTLAARLASQSSKSSTTGAVTKLNSGKYGSQTELDVVNNFIDNKLSPAAGVVRDLLKGQNPSGKKVSLGNVKSLGGEAANLIPMGIQNYLQMRGDPQAANSLLTGIIDGLGISANTYSAGSSGTSDWSQTTSKELVQFKQHVGAPAFKNANKQYDNRLNTWLNTTAKSSQYKNLNASDQATVLTKEKAKIKSDIFKQYNFKYKRAKSNGSLKSLVH